jgi:hypothetical protein
MPQSDAQRRASEANLKKGNPAAFSKPKDPPPAAEEDAGAGRRTLRAKATSPAKAKAKAPPRRREPADPQPKSSSGFLGGLFDGLRG